MILGQDPWKGERSGSALIGFALWIADVTRPLARACGVSPDMLRTLLQARLQVDLRGDPRGRPGSSSFGPALAMTFAWLAGMGLTFPALVEIPPATWMLLVQSFVTLFVGMILLLQLGTLLVDPTDIGVLGPRPVPGRALFAARIWHVAVYLIVLGGCLCFFPATLGCVAYRSAWPLVLAPLCTALTLAQVLGAVALLYAILMHLVGPAYFQRITFWLQIGGTAFLVGGVQLLQFVIPTGWIREHGQQAAGLVRFYPPAWTGELARFASGGGLDGGMALAAFVVPVLALLVALRIASRNFAAALTGDIALARRTTVGWPSGWLRDLGRRGLHTRLERCGYDVTFSLSVRDKLFMRAVYPMLVSNVVPFLAMAWTMSAVWPAIESLTVVALPYVTALGAIMLVEGARITEHPEAAWPLAHLPDDERREYAYGGFQALWTRVYYPLLFGSAVLIVLVEGPLGILDAALATTVSLLIAVTTRRLLKVHLPFSYKPKASDMDTTNLHLFLGATLYAFLAAGAHGLLILFAPRWIVLPIAVFLFPFVRREWPRMREPVPAPLG